MTLAFYGLVCFLTVEPEVFNLMSDLNSSLSLLFFLTSRKFDSNSAISRMHLNFKIPGQVSSKQKTLQSHFIEEKC